MNTLLIVMWIFVGILAITALIGIVLPMVEDMQNRREFRKLFGLKPPFITKFYPSILLNTKRRRHRMQYLQVLVTMMLKEAETAVKITSIDGSDGTARLEKEFKLLEMESAAEFCGFEISTKSEEGE